MSAKSTTTFTSRGRLTGLIRSEVPAAAAQNHTRRDAHRTEAGRTADDEALYYRARLILGESLPRPAAEPGARRAHGRFERKLPTSDPK